MATLSSLLSSIKAIVRNDAITDTEIKTRINDAVYAIAAGVALPDGRFSACLPDLYNYDTITTDLLDAYTELPCDYQRNVFNVIDSVGRTIDPARGGDYYSFDLFLNSIPEPNLTEVGTVRFVVVKGSKLYYQGIPSTSETLSIHYYREPFEMTGDTNTPDGIPAQFQVPLIVHYVCRDIFGDILEFGKKERFTYHSSRFLQALMELTDFIGNNDNQESTYFVPSGDNL